MFRSAQPICSVFLTVLLLAWAADASAQRVSFVQLATDVTVGSTQPVTINYYAKVNGIVQVQLFDPSWRLIAKKHVNVNKGTRNVDIDINVPGSAQTGSRNIWQAVLYTRSWSKVRENVRHGITLSAANGGSGGGVSGNGGKNGEWTPPGSTWVLDWNDEFSGSGSPTKWFPMLGYTPNEFDDNDEKGLRWTGSTENTSAMYSTREGNHWLEGGNLVLRAICDKKSNNAHGRRVETAYLMTGYPDRWDSSEPTNVKWKGKFVSPKTKPLYISCRVRTDQVKGHSTWFAFWLFSQTRAYNGNPSNGTEVDIMEVPKGAPNYLDTAFNVANHWSLDGNGSESKQFNSGGTPKSTDFVDVSDSKYHIWGIEWTTTRMKCYVDGKLFYTFTDNIPSNPVDMMMMLTMEFQKNAWDPNQGDGRFSGPYVSNSSTMKEMSRAYVDYVRVYEKK